MVHDGVSSILSSGPGSSSPSGRALGVRSRGPTSRPTSPVPPNLSRPRVPPAFVPRHELSPLARLSTWMSAAPAALAQLHRKGRIAVGCDADLVIWDPDRTRIVDPLALQQRHKLTPYAGRCLRGVVHATFLRGQRVWDDGRLTCPASGRLL